MILTIGQINLHSIITGGIGDKIVELMELDRVMDNEHTEKHLKDFVNILKMIKDSRFESVDDWHFVAR